MTQQHKHKKNLQYLLDKQELLNTEIAELDKNSDPTIILGYGLMSKAQVQELKARQQKMLDLLRVWTVPEIEQAAELLRSRMCRPCQRAMHTDEQPKCKDDFQRFVNAIMFKRAIAA